MWGHPSSPGHSGHSGHCSALFSRILCSQLRGHQCSGLCVHSYSESTVAMHRQRGDRAALSISSVPPAPSPSLAYDCCPGRSKYPAVKLWSPDCDYYPSLSLPCSRQFPLLSPPDELTQAQECFLPPFSPHPTSPGSPSFRSAICLNPLRHCAQDVSLSWSRASSSVGGLSILLEHLDPGGLRSLSSAPPQPAQLSGFSIPQALPFKAWPKSPP